jgi:hypothetical protein
MPLSKKYIAYLLILIPVVSFLWAFFRYTVNMPVNDDYPAILGFLNQYLSATSFHQKWNLLFAQHNEHRIVYCRLMSLIDFRLNKQVNFNVLSLIGNLSLAGIAIIFFRKFLSLNKSIFLFIPVTVLLFNLSSAENMLYTMCALGNFTVHLFILLTLSFLTSSTPSGIRNVLFASLFFLFAVFTFGAGIALLPVSIFILFYKRNYKHLLIFGCIAGSIMLFYFYHYFQPPNSGDPVKSILYFKVRTIIFFFAFLGNAFDYFLIHSNGLRDSLNIASIIGGGLFLLFIHITRQKYYQRNLFNYSIMLMAIVSAALTAISRTTLDLDMAAHSRYRINGIIFVISLYFWLIENYQVETKRAFWAIFLLTGWYYLVINLGQYEYLPFRQEQNYLEIVCANAGDSSLVYPDPAEVVRQRAILERSAELNIYHLPTDADIEFYLPHSVRQTGIDSMGTSGLEMTGSIHGIHKVGHDYLIDGYAFLQWKSTRHQKVLLGIKNQTDSLPVYFTANQISRFDLNPFFHKFNLETGGFRGRIREDDIKPGENSVWIRLELDNQVKTMQTDNKLIK